MNTTLTFLRMGMTVGLGVVGTRLLLSYLGEVDFGLIGALGATGALLQATQAALTMSSQRHLAYEIGRRDWDKLRRVFFTSLVVFVAAGTLLWIAGACLTPLVTGGLNIPVERQSAAWWVYQASLATLVVGVWSTPFRALLVANQEIVVTTVADAAYGVLRFISVLLLLVVPWDLMVSYAAMQLVLVAFTRMMYVAWCVRRNDQCAFDRSLFDRAEAREILRFAGWGSLGNLSVSLRLQGGVLLVTAFFGPAMNSANTIAVQVAGYMNNMKEGVRLAVQPVIVGAMARGDTLTVRRMTLASSKYIAVLVSLLFVPAFIEAKQLLDLWLATTPAFTLILVRLTMCWVFINVLFTGHILALQGTGNIGWYTLTVLIVSGLTLAVTYYCYSLGLPVWWLQANMVAGMALLLAVVVVGIGREIELPASSWFRRTFAPILAINLPAACAAYAVFLLLSEGATRLLLVGVVYGATALPLTWFVGLEDWEREQFSRVFGGMLSKLRRA